MSLLNTPSHSIVLSVLAYFDVFNYPLDLIEIKRLSGENDEVNLLKALTELQEQGIVFKIRDFYAIQDDIKISSERIEGNSRAKEYLKKATSNSKLIAKFPYVRGVYISGSLSKGYMAEDGDVDFFIVTAPNRLWIARTLLILYKKVFLLNSRKYFCVNYFVDEESLEIEQKNIFTATELATLLPMTNSLLYHALVKSNEWVQEYHSNAFNQNHEIHEVNRSLWQKMLEPLLNGKIGERIDKWFLKITLKKWYRKFPEMNKIDFDIAMKSTRKVSKHHPSNFQKKVLEAYALRLDKLNKKLHEKSSI